tara:strand:+ start:306 stop:1250 length:945 start_codon:yes stop_codon:yes gene_type:complete
MISNKKISVVIPVYNIGKLILNLLKDIPSYVDQIYLVDDKCPLNTGKIVEKNLNQFKNLKIFYNDKNLGVGGAVKIGYLESLKNEIDIVVKIDGDNQMNPKQIEKLVKPLINNFDYAKGNRFLENNNIPNYPIARFYGNILLSFMSKLSSGYWNIFDPINGYTAITNDCLKKLDLNKIDNGYFFETDMLFNLYNHKRKVTDIPVEIKYFKDQIQNMNLMKETKNFFLKNISRFFMRIKINYFTNNFTLASLFLIVFFFTGFFTIIYGGYNYFYYNSIKEFAPTGVVVLSSISLLLMVVSLMIFFILDNFNNPNK